MLDFVDNYFELEAAEDIEVGLQQAEHKEVEEEVMVELEHTEESQHIPLFQVYCSNCSNICKLYKL